MTTVTGGLTRDEEADFMSTSEEEPSQSNRFLWGGVLLEDPESEGRGHVLVDGGVVSR